MTLASSEASPPAVAGAAPPLLELRQITKRFVKHLDVAEKLAGLLGANVHEEVVQAVDRVSLAIKDGEVVGLVGEAGCGKSTVGRIIAGIRPQTEGTRLFRGRDVGRLTGREARDTALKIQMIFQDPYASLNPRMRVAEIIGEAPKFHGIVPREAVDSYVEDVMLRVGLDPTLKRRYPHQFSGGQRQRIGIARALAAEPEFIVADEPVSALDVSIQAQILNLLQELQSRFGLAYLFISHDLRVIRRISNRIAVMYLGRIVEVARASELYSRPLMPYTRALISAVPAIRSGHARPRIVLSGDVPSPARPPSGCRFRTRCPYAIEECAERDPALREITPGHQAACIRIGPAQPDIDAVVERGIRVQEGS